MNASPVYEKWVERSMVEKNMKKKSFMAAHKKAFWIGAVVLLVAVLVVTVVLPRFTRGQMDFTMETSTVISGSITETVDTYGVLEAQPSVTLKWKSDGTVGDFDLEIGDTVEEGDVLMSLDASSQSNNILNAYSDLLEAQNELDLLTATDADYQEILNDLVYQEKMLLNKKEDKLAWNYGQSSMERIDAVRDNYYAARAEVWELEEAYDEVKSLDDDDPIKVEAYEKLEDGKLKRDSYLRALNQILGIPFDIAVETDFIEYDQQVALVAEDRVAFNNYVDQSDEISAAQAKVQSLQNLVDQANIIAPSAGTVTSIDADPGELVFTGDVAVRVDNLDNLIVEVSINQANINKIEVGQEAILTFDAVSRKEYTGFVLSVDEDGTVNTNGVVQFYAEIKIEDADEDVKPGFTAVVNIVVNSTEEGLLVANDAVVTQDDGTSVVYVIGDDGSMEMVPVETGAESDTYTEIISDEIEEGDQIALAGTYTSDGENNGPGMGGGMGGGLGGILGGGGGR